MKIPFLKNFRRGFATNSSSSHSFVYLKSEGELGAERPSSYTGSEFGWEDFRLDTIREKLFYVLVGKIGGGWRSEGDASDEYELYKDEFPELSEEDFHRAKDGYIDHDSVGTIGPDEARDPHTVIFGGNDNDGYSSERAEAIRRGEIDWSKTTLDWQDLEHIQPTDEDGQKAAKAYMEANPWASRW